uniref:TLC domain-containing protein n=1 Tax=Octopus bimaculoides TaxID=37653 RepID=A0A0L8GI91_OCTBM
MAVPLKGLCIFILSFLIFRTAELILVRRLKLSIFLGRPEILRKWINIFLSIVHATVVSVSILICFYRTPKLMEDLIYTYSDLSYCVIAMSAGYFFHDTIDLMHERNLSELSTVMIIHHILVIVGQSYSIITYKVTGFVLVNLLAEINSIFLHLRLLLNLYNLNKKSLTYIIVSIVNLGTLIVFRIMIPCFLVRWILINKAKLPLHFYIICIIGIIFLVPMNLMILCRCFKKDFLNSFSD